jgi:short-subunit dehydrogenase involved in D-alanine esterification of teichoic acids
VSIILVSSGLALVPMSRCANYCASKAAVHALAWTLRAQLAGRGGVRVVEIVPPAVQTELHSQQPDLVAAGQAHFGLPLEAYADETWAALTAPEAVDEVVCEALRERHGAVEERKREAFAQMEVAFRTSASAK